MLTYIVQILDLRIPPFDEINLTGEPQVYETGLILELSLILTSLLECSLKVISHAGGEAHVTHFVSYSGCIRYHHGKKVVSHTFKERREVMMAIKLQEPDSSRYILVSLCAALHSLEVASDEFVVILEVVLEVVCGVDSGSEAACRGLTTDISECGMAATMEEAFWKLLELHLEIMLGPFV